LPPTINLGDVLTLQARATLADGSVSTVQQPTWSSSNTNNLRVSADGVVQATREGAATVGLAAGAVSASASTLVTGTRSSLSYTVRGTIRANDGQRTVLAGATVTIAGGWDAALTTMTDATGAFAFTNVSAPFGNGFPVRASMAGYRDGVFSVALLPRDGQIDLALEPVAGCAYAVNPTALSARDWVRNGVFDVITLPGCAWTASLIAPSAPGFQFTGSTTGTGSGRVTYEALTTYGYEPWVYTIRVEGPNGGSAIYVVSVPAR
jgi:hypothetical protein